MGKCAMKILAENGLLRARMEVEPVPGIMPAEAQRRLPDFRAVILDPNGGPDSIQWRGRVQSLSQMLEALEGEYGAHGLYGVHRNFRIVGHESSLREEVETLAPAEEISDQENEPEGQEERADGPSNNSNATAGSTGTGLLTKSWLRDNIEKIMIPVIVSVLTAALLALLGLSK